MPETHHPPARRWHIHALEIFLGFIACPLVNVPLLLLISWLDNIVPQNLVLLLPWVVNGGILLLALFFRPYAILGYLSFFVALFALILIAGVLFVGGCFLLIILMGGASTPGSSPIPISTEWFPLATAFVCLCGIPLILFAGTAILWPLIRASQTKI